MKIGLLVLGFAAALAVSERATPSVTVGSKAFAESEVLAEVIAGALEERGVRVERRLDLGGTLICLGALRSGAIDVYPEYTGTGLVAVLGAEPPRDGLAALIAARRGFAERFGLVWLDPFGFEDGYAIAVRRDDARRLGLATLSDLARKVRAPELAVSEEFLRRQDGLPAVERVYGLGARARSMRHELAYAALRGGAVLAVDAYTTDPELARGDLVLLEDDRHAFGPYHAAPVARPEALARPGVRAALEALAGALDVATVRSLNAAVLAGDSPREVARRWLAARSGHLDASSARRQEPLVDLRAIAAWTGRHLLLSASALLAASVLGVPLGVLAARRERLGAALLAALGVIETVPSLALLGLMLPVLGIGVAPALAALLLYALLPIVRGTAVGLRGVDAAVLEATTALGLSPWQRLRAVEMPLALPSIAGGLRTSAVIVIGTATLAAFIGAGGLGEPIFAGVELARPSLVLEGAIPAAALALVVDGALALAERSLRRGGA